MALIHRHSPLKRLSRPVGIGLTRDVLFLGLYYLCLYDHVWDTTELFLCFIIPKLGEIAVAIFVFNIETLSAIIRSVITLICPNLIPGLIGLTYAKFPEVLIVIFASNVLYCLVYITYSPKKT